jgi:hypothetical protein
LRQAHSSIEPDYIDDATAHQLYWLMRDSTGTVLIDEERASGIDTYYFFGTFDPHRDLVCLQLNPAMYSPSIYPSLRDLEDKYIVARIASSGVELPMFTELRLLFNSPSGPQLLAFLPTQFLPGGNGSKTFNVVRSPERYVGGMLKPGHFLSVARD